MRLGKWREGNLLPLTSAMYSSLGTSTHHAHHTPALNILNIASSLFSEKSTRVDVSSGKSIPHASHRRPHDRFTVTKSWNEPFPMRIVCRHLISTREEMAGNAL